MQQQQYHHPSSAMESQQVMPLMASNGGPTQNDNDDDDNGSDHTNLTPPNLLRQPFVAVDSSGMWTRQLFNAQISHGIGDVYVRVLQVYWYSRHARFLIGLAAASVFPATLILMLAVSRIVEALFITTDATDPKFTQKNFLGILLIIMTRLLLNHAVSVLSDGAICYVSADICLGRGVGASQRWPAALRVALWNKALLLIVAGALCFVAIFVGYCFFFVAGVYVVVTLYLTVPALVLEPTLVWPWDGLLRSFELTYDRPVFFLWCHTLLVALQTLCAFLIHATVNLVLGAGVKGGGMGSMFSVWGTFVGMLPNVLFVPAYSILKTILYIRARVELEGLTPDQLAEDMGHGPQLLNTSSSTTDHYQQLALQEEEGGNGSLLMEPEQQQQQPKTSFLQATENYGEVMEYNGEAMEHPQQLHDESDEQQRDSNHQDGGEMDLPTVSETNDDASTNPLMEANDPA